MMYNEKECKNMLTEDCSRGIQNPTIADALKNNNGIMQEILIHVRAIQAFVHGAGTGEAEAKEKSPECMTEDLNQQTRLLKLTLDGLLSIRDSLGG